MARTTTGAGLLGAVARRDLTLLTAGGAVSTAGDTWRRRSRRP
jgi:hypothetical protein